VEEALKKKERKEKKWVRGAQERLREKFRLGKEN